MTTFPVADVPPGTHCLPHTTSRCAVEALLERPPSRFAEPDKANPPPQRPLESWSRFHGWFVADVAYHPVVAATHLAFHRHYPLSLSPDMVWLMIAQGFANHVNARAEDLRPRFVRHKDKARIEVRRDDFVKGSPENPWPEAFAEFSAAVRGHIGEETHDLLLPRFSTTGPVEKAACEVVLLGAMQSYFSYECYSMCGIPSITLEGRPNDWRAVAERTRALASFGLEWWVTALGPILDQFVAAAEGRVDQPFWSSIYKLERESGGPYISGWLPAFFPYLKDHRTKLATLQNTALGRPGVGARGRPDRYAVGGLLTTEQFPAALSKAPFLWHYFGTTFGMEFLGGFVGVRQDEELLTLRPEIGWAVRDATPAPGAMEGGKSVADASSLTAR